MTTGDNYSQLIRNE